MRKSRKLIFAAVVASVFLVAIELLARGLFLILPGLNRRTFAMETQGTVVADRILNHKWVPSLTLRQSARGIDYVSYHNGQSWVERYDVVRKKPPNTYRIFYVGDSNVHGVVDWDKRMVELVETQLNHAFKETGRHIEVINTGTSSYSTIIYYLLIKHRILPYDPDLVVINVDMTDVVNDQLYGQRTIYDDNDDPLAVLPFDESEMDDHVLTPEGIMKLSWMDRWGTKLYDHLASYRLLCELVWRVRDENLAQADVWLPWHAKRDESANWLTHEWSDEIRMNVSISMKVLGKTIRLLQDNGVRVMLTGVPHHPQYTGQWSDRPHQVLADTAQAHQCLFLNTYESLRSTIANAPVTKCYFATDPTHFNEEGNKIWAKAQVDFLLKHREQLLP